MTQPQKNPGASGIRTHSWGGRLNHSASEAVPKEGGRLPGSVRERRHVETSSFTWREAMCKYHTACWYRCLRQVACVKCRSLSFKRSAGARIRDSFVAHCEQWFAHTSLYHELKSQCSNPACAGIFLGCHTSDIKIGTLVATLQGTWCYWVSTWTGWPSVSVLWLGELES